MDYSQLSMHELFRMEAESSLSVLADGVLRLNEQADDAETLQAMMRAAHSLKGAARVIQLNDAVSLAHHMEDAMVAMQEGRSHWHSACVAPMLRAIDTLQAFADQKTVDESELEALNASLTAMLHPPETTTETRPGDTTGEVASPANEASEENPATTTRATAHVRISPQHIERMLGLATEIQAEWQWLMPLNDTMQRLKSQARESVKLLRQVETSMLESGAATSNSACTAALSRSQHYLLEISEQIQEGLTRLEQYERSVFRQSRQLQELSVDCRMQPFAHGIQGFRRMVHDLGVELGRDVHLHIEGENTLVDRDILEKIKAPLQHLLRNAVDHGIGDPDTRLTAGKPAEGHVYLRALHQSGMLKIIVEDDGAGIDLELLRRCIVQRGHASAEMVERMEQAELLAFLFLPGFSMRETVSEISGRGVGLDVVEMTVRDVQGVMHVETEAGKGTRFELHLPISLAVTRALQVSIARQIWAVPLARLQHMALLYEEDIQYAEGQPFFYLGEQHIGLVQATTLFDVSMSNTLPFPWHVLVFGQPPHSLGLIVDAVVGIHDLVEKPLPEVLGKVQDIASCAVMPDGTLIYMMDTHDILRSMARFLASRRRYKGEKQHVGAAVHRRILVADDSITVRETERNMLIAEGYAVDVAVDGLDAWNMLNANDYDLLISDVDMPHMDGITLIQRMRQDSRFGIMPVIIVSYKENEHDRMRGLEAGADAYLAKSSFDDQSMLQKVRELLGGA